MTIRCIFLGSLAVAAWAEAWSEPVDVRHDDNVCVAYRAKVEGGYLTVRARIAPGWHTFAMDNKQRAAEKLAGKPSLGIDRPTEIALTGGIQAAGPWHQLQPKDFSKPELRWYSWGFENEALFVAKVRKSGADGARIAITGQACTETTCKNIDVALILPADSVQTSGAGPDLKALVSVR